MKLNLEPNILDPDGFYRELIDSQRDMDDERSSQMNCRLVLVLANHVGDREVLSEALRVSTGKAG